MGRIVQGIFIACILAMLSIGVNAQTKVVVIPMGENEPARKTVFVTSTLYTGDLVSAANALNNGIYTEGLLAGDALCQSRADAAQLPGIYKAWLSSSTTNAIGRVSGNKGAWYRTDGVKVGDIQDIVNESLEAPINLDENGNALAPASNPNYPSAPWTGTGGDNGTRYNNTGNYTCNNWTDDTSAYQGTYGAANDTDYGWTFSNDDTCDGGYSPIYCFEY